MSATVTVSTSVILAPTRTTAGNYIVYFPNISTNGRLITVRDNDGYASTNNSVVLSTIDGARFATGGPRITINQPFGFITLNSQSSGNYNILNTFAFPEGSAAAYVNQVTTSNLVTSTLQMIDIGTRSTNTFFTSTGFMYLNSNVMGQVSQEQLTSTVTGLGTAGYISTIIIPTVVPALYVATGYSSNQYQNSSTDPLGSIVYTQSNEPFNWSNSTQGYTFGFDNGGYDVVVGNPYILACGDALASSSNSSYLQYSIDGCNWNYTNSYLSSQQMRIRVSYANGMYHAIGSNGLDGGLPTIMWSRDAITWSNSVTTGAGSIPPFTSGTINKIGYARGIAYGNGRWVAAGTQNGSATRLSLINGTDGSNWYGPGTSEWTSATMWDVAFNGTFFLALSGQNVYGGNIVRSTDGVNWIVPPTSWASSNLNSDSTNGGYIAGNQNIWLVTGSNGSPSGQMMWYSLDNGDTWLANPTFATGNLSRPYWDGSIWWVGYYNPADTSAQGIYYSRNGSNWENTYIGTGGFVGGFPRGFATRNAQSNYSFALLSTVAGLQANFQTSSFGANTISTNSITAATMTVSSLFVNVQVISTTIEIIDNISTLNTDFISAGVARIKDAQISSIEANVISSGTILANTISTYSMTVFGPNTFTSQGSTVMTGPVYISSGKIQTISDSVAFGSNAGIGLSSGIVAIGFLAGQTSQGINATAIGYNAGCNSQGRYTTALGYFAGQNSQGESATAIGSVAGSQNQGSGATAVGLQAGANSQGRNSVAIGSIAGFTNQGSNSVAIGYYAGYQNQSTNTIVLNASGSALNTPLSNAFFVSPVRDVPTGGGSRISMYYNSTTKEVTTGPVYLSNTNVGIGTNIPAYNLDVSGSSHVTGDILMGTSDGFMRTTTASGNVYMQAGSNFTAGSATKLYFGSIFQTTTTMVADMFNQRIGIGTTTPSELLHLRGTAPNVFIEGTGGTPNAAIMLSNSGLGFKGEIAIAGGAGSYNFNANSGDLVIRSDVNNATKRIILTNTAGVTNNGIYLSNSFVGINCNAPGVALDVGGDIRASGNITAYSDERYKTNVFRIENALSSIIEMRGVFYTPIGGSNTRVGVIAQEMEKVLPEVVITDSSEQATKSVAYGNIVAVLIEAVKELSETVKKIQDKIM